LRVPAGDEQDRPAYGDTAKRLKPLREHLGHLSIKAVESDDIEELLERITVEMPGACSGVSQKRPAALRAATTFPRNKTASHS
jgi:CHAD domain-containing protein